MLPILKAAPYSGGMRGAAGQREAVQSIESRFLLTDPARWEAAAAEGWSELLLSRNPLQYWKCCEFLLPPLKARAQIAMRQLVQPRNNVNMRWPVLTVLPVVTGLIVVLLFVLLLKWLETFLFVFVFFTSARGDCILQLPSLIAAYIYALDACSFMRIRFIDSITPCGLPKPAVVPASTCKLKYPDDQSCPQL